MEQDGTASHSPKAASVQLRIVGENLDVVQEFPDRLKLKLSSDSAQQICTAQFLDGEREAKYLKLQY